MSSPDSVSPADEGGDYLERPTSPGSDEAALARELAALTGLPDRIVNNPGDAPPAEATAPGGTLFEPKPSRLPEDDDSGAVRGDGSAGAGFLLRDETGPTIRSSSRRRPLHVTNWSAAAESVIPETVPADGLSPGGGATVLDRASEVLDLAEGAIPRGEPSPGPRADAQLPVSHAGAGAGLAPAKVSAVLRSTLEPTVARGGSTPETSRPVDSADVEALAAALVKALQGAGRRPVMEAVSAATSDPAILATLRRIAGSTEPAPETERGAPGNAHLPASSTSALDGKLILAAVLLLAAGIAVPLLAGAAAEIILTNEVAIAALIVTVAALRKG